ncbi:hypothetical protein A2U01_0051720, partial [Trifolium medium]|nr:hypothetical protein [Trifolium medium]
QKLSKMKVSFDDYRNKYALQKNLITTLETTEANLADEKLKSAEVSLIGEEEKVADLAGIYVESSRAELITKIFEVESTMIEASSSQFRNAIVEGLDEDKE